MSTCFDSDRGVNPNIQGYVQGRFLGRTYTINDKCANSNTLIEYYCSHNFPLPRRITCSDGCYNGKCILTTPGRQAQINQLYQFVVDLINYAIENRYLSHRPVSTIDEVLELSLIHI